MLIFSRQNRFKCCNLHDLVYIFLDNGVMTTPKRQILSFIFTVSCFKKPLLIINRVQYQSGKCTFQLETDNVFLALRTVPSLGQ